MVPWREPYELRGSSTVLREARGEIPRAYSPAGPLGRYLKSDRRARSSLLGLASLPLCVGGYLSSLFPQPPPAPRNLPKSHRAAYAGWTTAPRLQWHMAFAGSVLVSIGKRTILQSDRLPEPCVYYVCDLSVSSDFSPDRVKWNQ